ncbi:hypothetical protein [Corynebacterium sp. HMSC05D03]|uniref:hypothetical protein n=1 Tax=Corynebacterium sp. HMSC05D03 TaxID=1581115 RepID=UPI00143936EB|nr:hypothetical protein [Corynebacterium sp. HMSC05D03]
MTEPRYVEVGDTIGAWRDYEVTIRFEEHPDRMKVLTMSREEAAVLRDKLTRYLGDHQ